MGDVKRILNCAQAASLHQRGYYAGRMDHVHKETATDFDVRNDKGYTVGTKQYNDQGNLDTTNDHHQTHIPIIINTPSNYEYRNIL